MGSESIESPKPSATIKSSGMNVGLMAGIGALVLVGVIYFTRNTAPVQP